MDTKAGDGATAAGSRTGSVRNWGPLGRSVVESLVDALPEARIVDAFVECRGTVPSLFEFCVRAIVPCTVARALVEARYLPPVDRPVSDDSDDLGASWGPRPLPWPSPWVLASECSAASGVSCVRRVSPRVSLRMTAWHWMAIVCGCAEQHWRHMNSSGYVDTDDDIEDAAIPATDPLQRLFMSPSFTGGMLHYWFGGFSAPAALSLFAPSRSMTHPWDDRIHVDVWDDLPIRAHCRIDGDQRFSIRAHRICM